MHALGRIFMIATTLLIGGGMLFLLLGRALNDSWKESMLGDLALHCIVLGIITAICGASCDLRLKQRQRRSQPQPPSDPSHPDPE